MQNRKFVRMEKGLLRIAAACGIALLGLAAPGCSTATGDGGGSGILTGDTTGGDGSLSADSGGTDDTAAVDVIVPTDTTKGDSAGGTDVPADAIGDTGPTDTGPNDTGPNDTGPTDTGPADTGPTPDAAAWTGPSFGTDGKSANVQKVVTLAFGSKTEGCDLTGDGKIDNTMAGLGGIIGSKLQDAVNSDSIDMLFDPKSYVTDGTPFLFNLLLGQPATGSTCKNPTPGCEYEVKTSSYVNKTCDATGCDAMVNFPTATITGTALKATADKFALTLSISGAPLAVTISKVQLSGTVADATSWKSTKNGLLCGYVTDADLNAAIDALPASALSGFGGAATVKGLLPVLAPSDIASTPGGPKDAKSLGLKIETATATITGLAP